MHIQETVFCDIAQCMIRETGLDFQFSDCGLALLQGTTREHVDSLRILHSIEKSLAFT
ncbi:hypothetical protein [uncultured Sphaerochaeta sp.]|uniref:hypothetical protein n=1 Tax=uncultured Sphaerochaeta sp. TaxID=886478 RepID=UPI00374A4833